MFSKYNPDLLAVTKGQLPDGSGHVAIDITEAGSTGAVLNKTPEMQITPDNSLLTPEVCSIATKCTHQRNQIIYTHSCVKADTYPPCLRRFVFSFAVSSDGDCVRLRHQKLT